jgi:hypothetical protein
MQKVCTLTPIYPHLDSTSVLAPVDAVHVGSLQSSHQTFSAFNMWMTVERVQMTMDYFPLPSTKLSLSRGKGLYVTSSIFLIGFGLGHGTCFGEW